ncbi:unnamed protein product [Trichogramma brassicae]|uniref:CCHC-type domain-containing protein n=1 Tax=Trichogramma brassicae TaxID=86971 RepID=A0A6H5J0V2_9HYME|nr:unnamed protein product [Trichogramma brassicae]
MIEIRDLDECTTKDEIAEALSTSLSAPHLNKDVVKTLWKAYAGTQAAVAALPDDLSAKALKLGHIRIGWVNCRIRGCENTLRCYRCWSPSHVSARCKGPDRSAHCFRCAPWSEATTASSSTLKCISTTATGTLSYNTSIHTAHGFTPHELIFARKARIPSEFTNTTISKTFNDILDDIARKLNITQRETHDKIIEAKKKSKAYYDFKSNAYDELELEDAGHAIDNYCRFLKHVAGEYTESDFIMKAGYETLNQEELKSMRMNKRDAYVARIGKQEKTRLAEAARQEAETKKNQLLQEDQNKNSAATQSTPEGAEDMTLEPWTKPDGQIIYLPREATAYFDSVISATAKELKEIRKTAIECMEVKEMLHTQMNEVASSTRINSNPTPGKTGILSTTGNCNANTKKIQLNDTYDIHEYFQPSMESTVHSADNSKIGTRPDQKDCA